MESSLRSLQLVLALGHSESFAREDFVSGPSNANALRLIDRWPDWPNNIVALAGEEGAGKSHLAAIWGEKSGARFLSARLLDQADLPGALSTGALVVEDIVPERVDQFALFHLLNLAREHGAYLLLTARTPPASWPIALPDLSSRLRAVPVITVAAPEDGLLRALIVKLAADRQIELDDALLNFLVSRVERSFAGARAAVSLLDQAALQRQRPVTRALAAELFRNGTP
jgi:chromosomal replication initiation ATPase DnaA